MQKTTLTRVGLLSFSQVLLNVSCVDYFFRTTTILWIKFSCFTNDKNNAPNWRVGNLWKTDAIRGKHYSLIPIPLGLLSNETSQYNIKSLWDLGCAGLQLSTTLPCLPSVSPTSEFFILVPYISSQGILHVVSSLTL